MVPDLLILRFKKFTVDAFDEFPSDFFLDVKWCENTLVYDLPLYEITN